MFASAWEQIGPAIRPDVYPVAGVDGLEYVAMWERSPRHGCRMWAIARAGHYGPERVSEDGTLKGAVQNLNAFHVARGVAR